MRNRPVAMISLAALAITLGGCASGRGGLGPPDETARPPFLALSIARQPSADFSATPAPAAVRTKENQVYAGLYRLGNGEATLDFDFDYQYTRYVYDGIDGRNRDLHRFQFPLRYARAVDGWAIDARVAPGLSTSSNVLKNFFDEISGDDLFATAYLQARREWRSRNWVIGLAYDRAFGQPRLYPLAGIEITPNDALQARLAFPDSGFRYRWSDRQMLSGRLFPSGHQWHVMTDDFDAEFDYRVEGWLAQLGWSVRLWKQVSLDISGGYEFARRHSLVDDLGSRIESAVEDQWLVLVGLRAGPAPLPYTHGRQFW